ncbi:ribosome maturation factor RimM [Clostridium hydrogeniformans]|uniref:ribosome maturation factor RimM n=1 Tax=Clostridium hydrogeniformans TaxID=349933 RepID=UPI000487E707|nr:ribosome maturation factor RimM [Clostridium hydrogeniformans]
MKEFMTIGQISKPHGVKGEVKVFPLTDNVKRFKKLKTVFIDDKEVKVVWCKLQSDRAILKLEGIESMDDAEKLRNKYLNIRREDAIRLPKDTHFIVDIIGCSVYDSNEVFIGEVKEIIKTGYNDVYWVKDGKKEVLVPVLKEIVYDIDVENKKIVIKPVGEWQDED